ncbi:hypothetical protein P9209_17085 [Prescottella defluvii]|nr:hypothetical protein P9209_17085 [Prescottella defluvii]
MNTIRTAVGVVAACTTLALAGCGSAPARSHGLTGSTGSTGSTADAGAGTELGRGEPVGERNVANLRRA